jgi:pimeloyl-ACP methyl ester carboxylesterase
MSELFSYNGFTIEFIRFGNGRETILAFHGFGRHARDFQVFSELIQPGQQVISVCLFAHGNSVFPEERIEKNPLSKTEWAAFLQAFLSHLNIEQFHLLGYSMGARVCLSTLETMSGRILTVLLIAPDGLKINWLYRFASGTALGRAIYKNIIDHPGWFFGLVNFLNKTGLLNDKLHRFVHLHLDTREKRILVHDAWLIYQNMFPDLTETAQIINREKIPVNMVFGEYDTVIRPKLASRLLKKTGPTVRLLLIPAGHRLITKNTADFIRDHQIWPAVK